MEEKESRAHQQDDLILEQPTNIEDYPRSTSRTTQSMNSHPPTQQLPYQKYGQIYNMHQQQQQQQQQVPLQPRYPLPQRQQPRGQEDMYTTGQQQFGILPSSAAPPPLPSHRGFSARSALSTIADSDIAPASSVASGGEGSIRSASPVGTRDPEHYPPSLYSRYPDHNFYEQQQRRYEQYEQQSRYYREANMQRPNAQEIQHHQYMEPYGSPYRHSVYGGIYGPQVRPPPPPIARHQPVQQLQAHRSVNSGPIPQNLFPITRDQLPTAPSLSAFSALHPALVFPELPGATSQATNSPGLSTPNNSKSKESSPTVVNGTFCTQNSDYCVSRHPNQKSIYSTFAAGSPVIAESIARPLNVAQEPTYRFTASPTSVSSSPARPSSIPHSISKASIVQARPKLNQVHSYSRQVTLSNIPPNEEVPPMPGKITSKTGKVRIQLTFDRPFFNAGGELSGRLEFQCSSSRSVMIADMIIELLGYEALTKDHLAPKVFHKTILRLQDMRHPSQAVQENIDPDADGYWMARKGRTIFPFRLNIQDSLPNSYDSKLGQVRYVASALALVKVNQHKEVINHTREVFIYETWTTDDITHARRISVKADTSKRLFMGGDGSLEMYAELTRAMVSSGGIVYVNVGVKNLTKKKILGIKLSLWRHITASPHRPSTSSQSLTLSARDQDSVKNYSEIIYKGEDYAFDSDDPRIIVLPVYIPSGVYSLRNTSFLHVQFFVQVSLMASMNKALAVELPVYITHASSWSDPPPRIPKDFVFPMHEDEPVKKNKTGVFSKKKYSPVSNTSNGSSTGVKKSPVDGGSHLTMGNMSPTLEASSKEMSYSRPITRRSPLKDPDSPTSVLNFSQAGNLFVVNPDTNSVTTPKPDVRSTHRYPEATRSAVSTRIPQSDEAMSTPSSISRPTPHTVADNRPSEISDESEITPAPGLEHEPEQGLKRELVGEDDYQNRDFDTRRLPNAPPAGSSKKENDISNSSKLGLRKTLAKLSISIPNHNSSSNSLSTTPGVSPRVLPTTARSANSITMESPDEITSTGSRSPIGVEPLSRQSSGSSLGSLKHSFEYHSRRSSIGSTRAMTVSPGLISPNTNMSKTNKYPLSVSSSPALSPSSSIASIPTPSGASSPILYPGASSTEFHKEESAGEGSQEIGRLSMAPTFAYVRLDESAPPMEVLGPDGYSNHGKFGGRSPTPNPSDGRIAVNQTSPKRPDFYNELSEAQHDHATSRANLTTAGPYDIARTAQGIRDEYYSGRSMHSPNNSTTSSETCATSQHSESRSAQYSTTNQVYEDPVGGTAWPNSNVRSRHQEQTEYGAQPLGTAEIHELQMPGQFNSQLAFQQRHSLDGSASVKTLPVQMHSVPNGSRQFPGYNHNVHLIQEPHRTPFQSLSEHPSLPPPSHYLPSQYNMEPPKLEQIQRPYRSCPSSPLVSSRVSRISSMEQNAKASSNPEFNIVSKRASLQPYRKFQMQAQDPMQHGEEFSPGRYHSPLYFQNDAAMEICKDYNPAPTDAVPRQTPLLSSSNSLDPVKSGLIPSDVGFSQQLEGVHAQRQHRSNETIVVEPMLMAHGEAKIYFDPRMQTNSTQHVEQIDQAAPCGSHASVPPPTSNRPSSQRLSPQSVSVAETLMDENPHINTEKNGQPQSARHNTESGEIVNGDQYQRAGVGHMGSGLAVEDSSCIARPPQPNANNPAVARINVSHRTSPLAFKGNVMTVNSSPPPLPETARFIANVKESKALCGTPPAVDDDLGQGHVSDSGGGH